MMNTVSRSAHESYDISDRYQNNIKVITSEPRQKIYSARIEDIKEKKSDAIRDIAAINLAIKTWMEEGRYSRVVFLMFGVNTGLRYSDIISLRVKDVQNDCGEITDGFVLIEGKTNARRSVYFNDAMKESLKFIIEHKGLKENEYLFTADGNKKAYFLGWEYNSDGDIIAPVKTGDKFDEQGNERLVAPIANKTGNRWYEEISKRFGAEGHITTHSNRKTFRYFISKSGVVDSDEDVMLASQCLGHASVETTSRYYCNVTESTKKKASDSINIGYEAFMECLSYINN